MDFPVALEACWEIHTQRWRCLLGQAEVPVLAMLDLMAAQYGALISGVPLG